MNSIYQLPSTFCFHKKIHCTNKLHISSYNLNARILHFSFYFFFFFKYIYIEITICGRLPTAEISLFKITQRFLSAFMLISFSERLNIYSWEFYIYCRFCCRPPSPQQLHIEVIRNRGITDNRLLVYRLVTIVTTL